MKTIGQCKFFSGTWPTRLADRLVLSSEVTLLKTMPVRVPWEFPMITLLWRNSNYLSRSTRDQLGQCLFNVIALGGQFHCMSWATGFSHSPLPLSAIVREGWWRMDSRFFSSARSSQNIIFFFGTLHTQILFLSFMLNRLCNCEKLGRSLVKTIFL